MPRNPEWIHHIPKALEELEAGRLPIVDRATVESLLHLSARQAIRLMHQFGAVRSGRGLVVLGEEFCSRLRVWKEVPGVRDEAARYDRLHERLLAARKELAGRRIKIQPQAPAGNLPAGIGLAPGRIEIDFDGIQDLLGKLLGLSQAVMSDLDSFEQLCGT